MFADHHVASAVADALRSASLCRACIAQRIRIAQPEVGPLLLTVSRTLRLIAAVRECEGCQSMRTVVALA